MHRKVHGAKCTVRLGLQKNGIFGNSHAFAYSFDLLLYSTSEFSTMIPKLNCSIFEMKEGNPQGVACMSQRRTNNQKPWREPVYQWEESWRKQNLFGNWSRPRRKHALHALGGTGCSIKARAADSTAFTSPALASLQKWVSQNKFKKTSGKWIDEFTTFLPPPFPHPSLSCRCYKLTHWEIGLWFYEHYLHIIFFSPCVLINILVFQSCTYLSFPLKSLFWYVYEGLSYLFPDSSHPMQAILFVIPPCIRMLQSVGLGRRTQKGWRGWSIMGKTQN